MFTIKYRRDNAALFSEAQEVCLVKPGSPKYDDALALAEEFGLSQPDLIQTFEKQSKPVESMLTFLRPKRPESYVLTTERDDNPGKPIAVVIVEAVDPNLPDVPGTGYQYVYYGDEVYIMNRFGQTVELINRKHHHKAP